MPIFPYTEEEAKHYDLIIEWLQIVNRERKDYRTSYCPTSNDWKKSALFRRLRDGKKPLKYPPPRSFSYPWYSVIEDPTPHLCDVGVGYEPGTIIVNQCQYNIIDEVDDVFTISYGKYKFKLWKDELNSHKSIFNWYIQLQQEKGEE